MRIAIGNDHAGYDMKNQIIEHIREMGHDVTDFGANNNENADYPEYGKRVADAVSGGEYDRGILICGSGVGISIAANKVRGIRAVVCSEPCSAELSRRHNDSNVLAFGARIIGINMAKMIVDVFLKSEFEGGRHQKRIDMINTIENE